MLEDTFALLRKIDHWCSKNELEMECVVNDWGMADFIRKETKHLLPCLGTLLNKRKKDPRINYKKGERDLYSQNSFNADFYQEFLRESFGIERAEWESCVICRISRQEKTACIFHFTRRIRRSIVRCMQCRKKETEADRDWYTNVRSIVKMRRFVSETFEYDREI